jgi:hypothetical protein
MHDHDYDEEGRCERRIMELEADLADAWQRADKAWANWEQDRERWNADRERWNADAERSNRNLDQLHVRNHADHMARLDRLCVAVERIADALGGQECHDQDGD